MSGRRSAEGGATGEGEMAATDEAEQEQEEGVVPTLGQPPALNLDCPFNPFKNDSLPMTWLEAIKTVLMVPVCVVRVVLWLSCMVIGFYFTKLALIGAKDVLRKPFPPWRRPLLFPVRYLARVVLFACGFHWISVKGKPASRDRAPVIVSNHVTFVDPVFIFFRHLPVIVTADENLSMPIVGAIMRAMQVISVNRVSQTSRRNASGEIKRRAMCNDWSHVMLFPEATTTNGRALVTFKAGAFVPGFAVQPMVVRYPHVHVDPSWVAEGPSTCTLLFRLMTQFHNYMEVEYLPIVEPTLQEQKIPRLFADRVRLMMARALNVTVTDHGYEDAALSMAAVKRKVDSGTSLLEFTKFERLFHLNSKNAKHFYSKFVLFGLNADGTVAYQDYLKGMSLPDCPVMRRLFQVFDRTGNGYFNFRQYALGLAFVLKHPKFGGAADAIFKYCDEDEDGSIGVNDLRTCLRDISPTLADDQVVKIFHKIDAGQEGTVRREGFRAFLEANPEFLALFLIFQPKLVANISQRKMEFSAGNGESKDK